jgi:hypothetical protein
VGNKRSNSGRDGELAYFLGEVKTVTLVPFPVLEVLIVQGSGFENEQVLGVVGFRSTGDIVGSRGSVDPVDEGDLVVRDGMLVVDVDGNAGISEPVGLGVSFEGFARVEDDLHVDFASVGADEGLGNDLVGQDVLLHPDGLFGVVQEFDEDRLTAPVGREVQTDLVDGNASEWGQRLYLPISAPCQKGSRLVLVFDFLILHRGPPDRPDFRFDRHVLECRFAIRSLLWETIVSIHRVESQWD